MDENLICPFCQETDFDAIGLKHHLSSGGCEKFNATITIEQECHLTSQSSQPEEVCPFCDCVAIDEMGRCEGCGKLTRPPPA